MTDSLTRKIIANALPGARIVEDGADASSITPDSDATAPSLDTLVSKYFGERGMRTRISKPSDGDADGDAVKASQREVGNDDDMEMVKVEIDGVRRTAVINRAKKTLRGVSG